jgi:hypothetical protein
MKDAYEVLYQKEADLARVRQEIESLKIVASLLAEELTSDNPGRSSDDPNKKPSRSAEKAILNLSARPDSDATGTEGPSPITRRPRFWNPLRRRG